MEHILLLLIQRILAPWCVPFLRNPQFTGRLALLESLHSCFDNVPSHPYFAIHGLGGSGKSAVTTEFTYQARERHDCAVFWVSVFDRLRFEQSYRAIAELLQIPEAHDPEKNVLSLVQQKISQYDRGKWLMIVDNVDQTNVLWDKDLRLDGSCIRLWDSLPRNENGMILFTTRSRRIAVQAAPNDYYPLEAMNSSEAEGLVHISLQNQPALYSIDAVGQFLESLTYLPLAIIQALAYVKTNNTSLK